MNNYKAEKIIYSEIQRFRQWWIWLIISLSVGMAWWMFAVQIIGHRPFGNRPASDEVVYIILILLGFALPALFIFLSMKTIIYADRIVIRYSPFYSKTIHIRDIKSFSSCQYRPIRDFGGWGIRWNFKLGRAYTVSGDRALKLELHSGKKILIGSQEPDKLATTIKSVLNK